jgi:hypothetical protein
VRAEQVADSLGVVAGLDGLEALVPVAGPVGGMLVVRDEPRLANEPVGPGVAPQDAATIAATAAIRQVASIGDLSNRHNRAVWGIAKE